LDRIKDPEKRHCRLVELNVIEQCINVYKTGVVQRKRVETYQAGQEFTTPRIHGLVFDPKVGRLKRLNVSCSWLSWEKALICSVTELTQYDSF